MLDRHTEADLLRSLAEAYRDVKEGYRDPKYNPTVLQKDLHKGGKNQDITYDTKNTVKSKGGSHAQVPVKATDSEGKEYDTDLGQSGEIGGPITKGVKGKPDQYGPSFEAGHRKVKKQLKDMGQAIDSIKKNKPITRGKQQFRMSPEQRNARDTRKQERKGINRAMADDIRRPRKQNAQGKGNKAARRFDGGDF